MNEYQVTSKVEARSNDAHNADLQLSIRSPLASLNDSYQRLQAQISNLSRKTLHNVVLELESNNLNYKCTCTVGTIDALSTKEAILQVKMRDDKPDKKIVAMSEKRTYLLSSGSLVISVWEETIPLQTYSIQTLCGFALNFMFYNTSKISLNILVLGFSGATKSSFINSCYTLLSKEHNPIIVARAGGSNGQVTKYYHKYIFDGLPFAIWDTLGINNDNWTKFPVNDMLQGRIAEGTNLNESIITLPRDSSRRIHSVIYVIPVGVLHDEIKLNEVLLFYKQLKMNRPIVAISLADTIVNEIRNDPLTISQTNTMLKNKRAEVSMKLQVLPNDVFFLVNYTEEEKRTFGIDRNNFAILYAAVSRAQHFLLQELEDDYKF